MSEAKRASTTFPGVEFIDLDHHPDGCLLRALSIATKLTDKKGLVGLAEIQQQALRLALITIINTEALTSIGVTMKATFVMGDRMDPMEHMPCMLYASVIRDYMRMGVPT